jgi:hypothetical protein
MCPDGGYGAHMLPSQYAAAFAEAHGVELITSTDDEPAASTTPTPAPAAVTTTPTPATYDASMAVEEAARAPPPRLPLATPPAADTTTLSTCVRELVSTPAVTRCAHRMPAAEGTPPIDYTTPATAATRGTRGVHGMADYALAFSEPSPPSSTDNPPLSTDPPSTDNHHENEIRLLPTADLPSDKGNADEAESGCLLA